MMKSCGFLELSGGKNGPGTAGALKIASTTPQDAMAMQETQRLSYPGILPQSGGGAAPQRYKRVTHRRNLVNFSGRIAKNTWINIHDRLP
jgi:hypothetical protein